MTNINKLKALRRKELDDDFITDYDKVEKGDKIKEIVVPGPADTTKTIEINQSHLYRPAPSTTSDVEMLRIEAQMEADGKEIENPHIPSSQDVLETAVEKIESEGNTPAWRNEK